jgi:hypothetical protein
MSRSEDWLVYMKDPESFDQDHFAQSLTDTSAEYAIDPELFFSFSRQSAQIIERLDDLKNRTLFNGLYYIPKPQEQFSAQKALEVLKETIEVLSEHSRVRGDLDDAKLIRQAPVKIISNIDEFHFFNIDISRDRPHSFTRLNDAFQENALDKSELYFAVLEAVVNMTTYPMVRNYILNPDVQYDADFRPFYDLFIGGAAFTEFSDEIVLYVPKM